MLTPLSLTVISPHLSLLDLKPLFTLVNSDKIEWVTATVARLPNAQSNRTEEVKQWAVDKQVDVAWVDPLCHFADFGLIISDMDSTFITIESIDEIAARVGIKKEIAAITEKAMQGQLDFSSALKERVALLAGLPEKELDAVYQECVQLTTGAQQLVKMARQNGLHFMLLSGGFTYFVNRLQKEYGLDEGYANTLEIIHGKLTGNILGSIIDGEAKARLLIEKSHEMGLSLQQVIAVGDGANDIPMLKTAGAGIAFHAKPIVIDQANYSIQYSGLDSVRWLFR